MELPGVTFCEPAFHTEVDWLLCDGLNRLADPDGESLYLRLSTRPLDQAPFAAALDRLGEATLRRQVVTGGYRLSEAAGDGRPGVTLAVTGVMVPEALAAAAELDDEGVDVDVVMITSADRLYRGWQRRHAGAASTGRVVREPSPVHLLVPPERRGWPLVSVHDASSHALAWLGSAIGVRQIPLGVDRFGESGTIADLHEIAGISAGNIVNAALLALEGGHRD
jgi:pyruvate dehydrogenase E1 component